MTKFIDKINELERIEITKYYTEFRDGFKEIHDWAKSEGFLNEAKLAKYEIDICSLIEKKPILSNNKSDTRFVPEYSITGIGNVPEITAFTDEQFLYYERRMIETDNIFLKVRYSDFLFEYGSEKVTRKKYQISQFLLASLVESCRKYQTVHEDSNFILSISRLVEVSLSMNNKKYLQQAIQLIHSQLIESRDIDNSIWACNLSQLVRIILDSKFKGYISEELYTCTLTILTNLKNKCFENHEYHFYRLFIEESIALGKFEAYNTEQIQNLRLDIGKSYELEAEYQGGRQQKSSLIKAFNLEQALEYYKNMGETEKINDLKVLIKQTYETYQQSDEMATIKIPFTIPTDYIDNCISPYIISNIHESLDKLAKSDEFIPNVSIIKQQQSLQEADNNFFNLVSKSIIHGGNKIVNAETKEESKKFIFITSYVQELTLNLEIFLKAIFEKLIEEHSLSADHLMEKFDSWKMLDERNYPLVKAGIENFFKEDYVSSIHILVPQFESTFRRFLAKLGFATTSLKKDMVQYEITFNEFLVKDYIKTFLGEDIHTLIQIIMVEPMGLNLRNEIAHGLIKQSDITKSKCILVIYLFLILTRYDDNKE